MSFVAQCPYCRTRIKLPDHAVGWSITCRNKKTCGDAFTAVPCTDAPEPLAERTSPVPRPTPAVAVPRPERPSVVPPPPPVKAPAPRVELKQPEQAEPPPPASPA